MATSLEKSPSKKFSKENPPNEVALPPVKGWVDQKKAPDRSPGFLINARKTGFLKG
jgi:hypothetical protein